MLPVNFQNFSDPRLGTLRVVNDNSKVWFVLSDACKILGILNPTDAAKRLEPYEKMVVKKPGSNKDINIINQSGLFSLIMRSNKPSALKFKKWISSEVLPAMMNGNLVRTDTGAGEGGSFVNLMQVMVNQFRLMEENQRKQELAMLQLEEKSSSTDEAVDSIISIIETQEKKLEELETLKQFVISSSPDKGAKTASWIANELGFYSETKAPHAAFIAAVARECKIKHNPRLLFDTDYSQSISTNVNGVVVPEVFFKQKGISLIADWIESNMEDTLTQEFYKKKYGPHKPGDVKKSYYELSGRKYYIFNENGEPLIGLTPHQKHVTSELFIPF